MYIPQETYENIYKYVVDKSVKHSEFPATENITNTTDINVVQDGINKRLPATKVIESIKDNLNIHYESSAGTSGRPIGNFIVDEQPAGTIYLPNDVVYNSDVPTKLSDLNNDVGFITASTNNLINYYTKTNTYTKAEVNSLIQTIPHFEIQVVSTLPSTGVYGVLYLVPSQETASQNLYDEYIWAKSSPSSTTYGWEKLGTASLDLANYATKTWVENKGYYIKPTTGIPSTDLSNAVQTSLSQADSAVQPLDISDVVRTHFYSRLRTLWVGTTEEYERIDDPLPTTLYILTD